MRSRSIITIALTFLISLPCISQNEANIWYFGNYAGLDFTNGSPVVLTNSAMSAFEGCSSISDANGNLLFYTDGMTVWNTNHEVMNNGIGLYGNSSTTQCLIVKQPETPSTYFIFTIDAQLGPWGFRYSIVDMALQSGLGAVTDKNIPISAESTEKLCAVSKSVTETWIMAHEWNNNQFAALTFDASGLNSTPVVSSVGTPISGSSAATIGYMKFSPNGNRIAYSIDYDLKRVEVFDFDKSTGIVSNSLVLDSIFSGFGAYGIEFSPNSKILYAANEGLTGPNVSHVYQWNLDAGTTQDIIDSKIEMGAMDNAGALQLAPDGKIYLSETNTDSLGVINFPDLVGTACDFEQDAIDLSPGGCNYGLPGFDESIFQTTYFSFTGVCYKDSSYFSIEDTTGVDSVLWNFGDPQSGVNDTSTFFDVFHVFTESGTYDVQLIRYINGIGDTIISPIIIYESPSVFLGNDTSFCANESLLLNAGSFSSYLWQDGSTDSFYVATEAAEYFVQIASSAGCAASDTIQLTALAVPDFSLGEDTAICDGSIVVLDPNNPGPVFLWQDGTTNSTYTVTDEGNYWLKITNQNGCSASDSIYIDVLPSPPVPYVIFVNGTLISSIYLGDQWYFNGNPIPGANLNYYVPTQNGTYQVMVIDSFGCYSLSDPFEVTTIGIDEINSNLSIEIYPNPFHDFTTIKINSPLTSGNIQITIINSQGQVVRKENLCNRNEIRIERGVLSNGIYLILLNGKDFSILSTKKLVMD